MQRYSLREVVEMAVRTEKLGQEFYTGMAKRFDTETGLVELFTKLAGMELRHERTFTDLLGTIPESEPEQWDEVQNYLRAMMESEFFLGTGKSLPGLDHVTDVAGAVDFAIGFEKETALYFLGMRQAVGEADRSTVDEIIKEETRHIAILQSYREAIAS